MFIADIAVYITMNLKAFDMALKLGVGNLIIEARKRTIYFNHDQIPYTAGNINLICMAKSCAVPTKTEDNL